MNSEEKTAGVARNIPDWSITNWVTFLLERAPPLIFLLLASGPCLSALYITEGFVDLEKFAWAVTGQLVVLLLIRVMDDVKDYEKDVVVHPDRPLPRGLIKYDEVVSAIRYVIVGLMVYSVILGIRFNGTVAFFFLCQLFFTILMYFEFFCGEALDKTPIINGIIHQLGIYISAYFVASMAGASLSSVQPFLIGSVSFSGFFTYEICRKLDPTHPYIKGTYLVVYGQWPTFCFVLGTVLVGVVSSCYLDVSFMLWPIEAIMISSLLILFLFTRKPGKLQKGEKKPKAFKIVEGFSILYLMLHMWSGYLAKFF